MQNATEDDTSTLKEILKELSFTKTEETQPIKNSTKNSDEEDLTEINDAKKPLKFVECPICRKRFTRKDSMSDHVRSTHTKERPYLCQYCSVGFPTHSTRSKHERTHVGEKRHQCVHCGLKFSGKPSLNYHLKVHSGERPYKCELCEKDFIQNSHLRRHIAVHTGEKPFHCGECGMRFVRNSSLQSHLRRHTGEVLFTCQHCERTFNTKETFNYHLKSHSGIKPYCCEVCGWSFIKSSHLKRHLTIHTKNGSSKPLRSPPQSMVLTTNEDLAVTGVNCKDVGELTKGSVSRFMKRWSYSCTFCPKQFAHKRSLDSHLKFHLTMERRQQETVATSRDVGDEEIEIGEVGSGLERLPVQLLCDVNIEEDLD